MSEPRPSVSFDPSMRFGCPQIRGVSVEAIADALLAEGDPAVVAAEYDMSRVDLALACWFAARWGLPHKRARRLVPVADWKGWLDRFEDELWHDDLDKVPLP